jgi:phosphoglycerol transferase MdoB-like AlkP superfamily enzyme
VYPKEIIDTLLAAYVPVLIAAWAILAAALVLAWRLLKPRIQAAVPIRVTTALLMTPLLAMLCAGLIRSTLDHRAVNPSTVALSPDPMVNDLAMNSLYTLLYAVYEEQSEPDGGFRYSDMPKDQVVAQVRAAMEVDPGAFVDDALPTLHSQTASRRFDKPKNLVIILEESLGAEFVGALGGLPLTPRLDALAAEGLWFKNLYATGTRSVRGIEAVVTGFTPTPARSVVKLGRSQRGFFTLGELLLARGYETSFIYGGDAQFDNVGRFFTYSGFSKVFG